MTMLLRIAFAVLVGKATLVHAAERPEDFSLHFAVQVAQGASLQRFGMPREALAAMQTPDAADVRIFNGHGQPVPMAPIPPREITIAAQPLNVPIYPVMATTQHQQKPGNLSLRIEKTAGRSVVRVLDGAEAKPTPSYTEHIATLVDSRQIQEPLAELTVDADLPPGEPIMLTVTASTDLKTWRTLAQDVPVFRFGQGAHAPGSMTVPLTGVRLNNEYLRISWPQGVNFKPRGVRITPAATQVEPQRIVVPLTSRPDGKGFLVSLPFSTPLQALDIRVSDTSTLVPILIAGRGMPGEKWRTLASGVVYRIKTEGVESTSPPILLNGVSLHELRIEPAPGTAGFAEVPHVSAMLDPQDWVFVASGPPPFTLAIGRAGASKNQLSLAGLIPGYAPGAEQKLPVAKVDVASATTSPPNKLTRIGRALGAPSGRSLILWAVLVGGVIVLAGIAWKVMRQLKPTHIPHD